MQIARVGPLSAGERVGRALLYAAWFALVLFLVLRHVVWRDEVRALTIALAGDSVPAMLRGLHGEGHPALWYLMLRGAHDLVPVREVLPAVGFAVAAAAMAILVIRSPFRPGLIALILFGGFGLYEYAVVARNYGISMLVLFALAALYTRWRDRGIAVGLILALLCNTNVPSALLAACFLLFWLIELVGENGFRWNRKYGLFVLNGIVAAAAGALLCFLTVYPPVHDAAVIQVPGGITAAAIWTALSTPSFSFPDFLPLALPSGPVSAALLSILLLGSVMALIRTPGGFLAGLAAFLGFELFFQLVYPGYYRHEALLLVFLLTLHWLAAEGRGGRWPEMWRIETRFGRAADAGTIMFIALLALQLLTGLGLAAADFSGIPYSRSRDLADLLKREHLTNAVLIADSDTWLEPLPYYAANPIYLMRTQNFGHIVRFTRHGRVDLNPDDFLRDGRVLQARTGRPVVLILRYRLGTPHDFHVPEAIFWTFSGTADQIRRFQADTRRLARFGPAITDESYDVYLLNPPLAPARQESARR